MFVKDPSAYAYHVTPSKQTGSGATFMEKQPNFTSHSYLRLGSFPFYVPGLKSSLSLSTCALACDRTRILHLQVALMVVFW